MRDPATWLRISYRTGAVADGLVAAVMFAQAAFATRSPLTDYVPEIPYRYALGLAGSLMLGWTLLLLWADRRPVERRGILVITNIVLVGLMGCALFALAAGFMPARSVVALLLFQGTLFVLFMASYVASRRGERTRTSTASGQVARAEPLRPSPRSDSSDRI